MEFAIGIPEDASCIQLSFAIPCCIVCRFPEDSLYLNKETWRMIRIGEGPLGFGECPGSNS